MGAHNSAADDPLSRIERTLDGLARDRTRGARELVLDAARSLAASAAGGTWDADRVGKLALRLVRLHPEMAPFYHLAAALLAGDPAAESLAGRAAGFAERIKRDAGVGHGASLVTEGSLVVTYSRSGSVLAALLAAHRAGIGFRVCVGEGRPVGEGREVAADLAGAGLNVELMIDAALFSRARDADVILVGADAIGCHSFVNKIGTRELCAVAWAAEREVYVLADETKFLPEMFWVERRDRNAAEVWATPPDGVVVRNPYFEATPLAEVKGVVTGSGTLSPDEAAERVAEVARSLEGVARVLGIAI